MTTPGCTQVHGLLSDFLFRHGIILEFMLYDNACQFVRFCKNNATFSEATKYLSTVPMLVDKLHFPNHTGKWCRENCDPRKEKSLKDVNSVVCEQKFTFTNRFKNVKCMSSTHFMLYLLYILDAQNLRILGRLKEIKPKYVPKTETSGKNEVEAITDTLKNIDIAQLTSNCEKNPSQKDDDHSSLKAEIADTKSLSSEKEQEVSKFPCPFESCDFLSPNQRGIKIHISRKHKTTDGNKNDNGFMCKNCEKSFSNQSGLSRHVTVCDPSVSKGQSQFMCPKCQKPFAYKKNLNQHLKTSKTCGVKTS